MSRSWSLALVCLGLGCSRPEPPVDDRVVEVAAGYSTACARTEAGEVYCWGAAKHGALGLGDRGVGTNCPPGDLESCSSSPSCCVGDDEVPGAFGPVDLGGSARSIAAGNLHTCAVLDDGDVHCWGSNTQGALGLGASTPEYVGKADSPRDHTVPLGVEAELVVAGSLHTCALTRSGNVRCWGQGTTGALGYANGDTVGDDETPAEVGDVRVGGQVRKLFAGLERTCVILIDDQARCWGVNDNLQVGVTSDFVYGDDEHPDEVPPLDLGAPIVDFALGQDHTCALTEGGDVRCWGVIRWAGTADADVDTRTAAASEPVMLGGPAVAIAAGAEHTCAVLDDGELRCWGSGPQAGYASTAFIGDDETPAQVGSVQVGDALLDIAGGYRHSCALTGDGGVRCWGTGGSGVLGQPEYPGGIGDDEHPDVVGPLDLL